MTFIRHLCVPLFLLLHSALVWADFSWPTFHYAPDMKITWTADRMVYNGMPMKVENFKCECSVEDLLAYYRGRWEKEKKQVVVNDLGTYLQIGFADKKYFYAVVMKPDIENFEYSMGRITISELPNLEQKRYVLGDGVPKPGDALVVNDVLDAMPGRRSRTVLMTNSKSVQENTDFYRKHYQSKGWKSYLRPLGSELGGQAISYSQGNKDANVVIFKQGGQSHILLNIVTEVR